MKHKFLLAFLIIITFTGLTTLGLWILVITKLSKMMPYYEILTLFLAPFFFTFSLWVIFKTVKAYSRAVIRYESHQAHADSLRYSHEKSELARGKIPKSLKSEYHKLDLKHHYQSQSLKFAKKPGIFSRWLNAPSKQPPRSIPVYDDSGMQTDAISVPGDE